MSDFLPLAQALSMGLKGIQMYTAAHPRSQDALKAAQAALSAWLQESPQLQLVVGAGKAFVNGQPVEVQGPHMMNLIKTIGDRHVSGFVFERGVTPRDIQAFLEILLLKPQRLEELGGVQTLLDQQGISAIRVSQVQYREVREGDVGAGEGSEGRAPAVVSAPAPAAVQPAAPPPVRAPQPMGSGDSGGWAVPTSSGEHRAFGPPEQLINLVRQALLRTLPPPPVRDRLTGMGASILDAFEPADLSGLATMGQTLGLTDKMPSASQMGVLRQVLMDLPSERQLSILAGIGSLPEKPQGLGLGIKALAPEILSVAVSTLLSQNTNWEELQGPLMTILSPLPERSALLKGLSGHLRSMNVDAAPAEVLQRRLEWEALSPEAKLVKVLDEGALFRLSLEQRLALLRELLDGKRTEAMVRCLERILETLQSENPALRGQAAQTLAGMALWASDPGLPLEVENQLDQGLRSHFGWEPDPLVHRHTAEGLERLLTAPLERGQLVLILEEIQELQNHAAMLNEAHPWRTEALGQLKASLQQPEALDKALACLFRYDKEQSIVATASYFEFIGGPMVRHLIQALGKEPDRGRRGRLMDAIRTFGPLSLQHLRESLTSPIPWFLARNLLTLLSEAGDAGALPEVLPLLRAKEVRVRRAAVRAAWKLGGPTAEPHLLAMLKDADPETQLEIIFGLGQMRSETAVPTLLDLLQDKRTPEALRIKSLETLAFIQSPRCVQPLMELIKKKGFFSGSESPVIRLGAARALAAIFPSGRQGLQQIAESEPKGEMKDAFLNLLR
ncbi:MAG TPA: HEAT repeat domain-containing protein [Holophagaceae bacterium]|nr:HEAT repeat domain-containing protein [Holophagaceae bacterium]